MVTINLTTNRGRYFMDGHHQLTISRNGDHSRDKAASLYYTAQQVAPPS